VKVTLRDGTAFDGVTALQRRPATLYFWDAAGKQQAVREDQVAAIEPAPDAPLPELQILPAP
jgi:hypothetical protein